ncbi:hypothetical protein Adt_27908 [Abeliophyllum distichum]|uniref:Uncharacterized protein n=1 Tax=Abeliophyllum distichum TaxID=126358 RepID=A0ABD1RV23_9LAMI
MIGEGEKVIAESSTMKRKCLSVEGSSKKMKNIVQSKLEVNDVRIIDAEKDVAYTEVLFENSKSEGQNANNNNDFEHPVTHPSKLIIKVQESLVGDDISSKLKKKKTTDDEVTPDAPLKRQKKPAALLHYPWVNQYDSIVGTSMVGTTTKYVVKGKFAFKIELCP